MKKIFFAAIAAIMLFCASAPASAQFRYAPVVGVNMTTLSFKHDLAPVSQTVGGQAGVLAELMFPGIGFGLDFGAIYNMGGAKVDLGAKEMWESQGYGNERIMLHQLNIPFHLRFKWTRLGGLEDVIAPFAYGGPDFNILLGHSKCEAMQFAGGALSVTAGLGAELWRKWQVSVSYTWGMTYCMKANILTDYSARGRQWTVRVARFF